MKNNLTHARTCVYNINYHIVWSVKYRRKILSAEIEQYLKELTAGIAEDKGFVLHLLECREGTTCTPLSRLCRACQLPP